MAIQPIRNNVLVRCLESRNQTESGLIIPESVAKESNKVEIIAVGNGTAKKPMRFKPGQIAHRVKDWGQPVTDGSGVKYYLMDEAALIAIDEK